MRNYKDYLIFWGATLREALIQLDFLAKDAILFVTDEKNQLLGSLTDGDVRRGLLRGLSTEDKLDKFIQRESKHILKTSYTLDNIIKLRNSGIKVLPVLDNQRQIVNVVNFEHCESYLPVDAVIMAGGRGSRLSPLTDSIPKPLLKVGNKPIIDHNIDRLIKYGVDDFWLSIRYLGEQIEAYYENGDRKGVSIKYVRENKPLGTIGALRSVESFGHDVVLVTNSDILTTLDYEDFYLDFIEHDADMSVVTIPYLVDIPYAVMETDKNRVLSFKEKPTFTYYSNGGIYLIKKEVLNKIPEATFYNTTDLMETLIKEGGKLISYPMRQYWLDIGKPEDFDKAQQDIKHLGL